jgi:hypothetical protein
MESSRVQNYYHSGSNKFELIGDSPEMEMIV